jgi:hypothetical protein
MAEGVGMVGGNISDHDCGKPEAEFLNHKAEFWQISDKPEKGQGASS